jgi:hypothetical protein
MRPKATGELKGEKKLFRGGIKLDRALRRDGCKVWP